MIKVKQEDLADLLANEQNWASQGLDPNKGIILIGNPGVGKTYAMREWAKTKKIGWGHPGLPSVYKELRDLSTKLIFTKCELLGPNYLLQFIEEHEMWLDDLGYESTECVSYGTRFSPIQDLIFHRHKLFPTRKTSFTTNYTIPQLEQKYGQGVASRIQEMCNVIIVTGKDRRL